MILIKIEILVLIQGRYDKVENFEPFLKSSFSEGSSTKKEIENHLVGFSRENEIFETGKKCSLWLRYRGQAFSNEEMRLQLKRLHIML